MRAARRPLSPGWVGASVRARHLLARRLGRGASRSLASSASLERALAVLAGSAYGRSVRGEMDLAEAQRALAETVLWHVRVLAGWVPPHAVAPVRTLAGWFELANVEDRLGYLAGGPLRAPFQLGGLASAEPRIARALSITELRHTLSESPWGDPGSEDPGVIRLALRLAWARRVLASVPEAREWTLGAVGLLLARELLLAGRSSQELAALRPPVSGEGWMRAHSVDELRRALPAECDFALGNVSEPEAIWLGEAAWWRRVEQDGELLARDPQMGRVSVIGTIVLLAADAVRVSAALESASREAAQIAIEVFERFA